MTLEAKLLKIIEEQQLQLKQQQQEQEKALRLIQQQSGTIGQLKSYTQTLNEKHNEAAIVVQEYQKIVKNLSEQTISQDLSQRLQANLESHLQKHLKELVTNLNIELEVKQIIRKELPTLAQEEIDKKINPLAIQLKTKFDSVSNYHVRFQDLIQKLSSRL